MDNSLHEKLKAIEDSLPEIEKQLSQINISNDQQGYAEMAKKHSDVSIIVDLFNEWKKVTSEIEDAVELINSEEDEDMKNEVFILRIILMFVQTFKTFDIFRLWGKQ